MNFAKKIFLSLLGVSLVVGLVRSYFLYDTVEKSLRQEAIADYRQRVHLLSDSFRGMEGAADTIAFNAAQVVSERIRATHKLPSNEELARLAKTLKVAQIQIADHTGRFTRATETNPSAHNLFDYCPEYRDFFTGKTQLQQTPMVPDEKGLLYKYTMIPTADRTYVIDVNVHFDFVTQLLKEMIDADPDLNRLELFAPSGQSLGRIISAGLVDRSDATPELLTSNTETWQGGQLLISHSAPADLANCCECRIKNLVGENEKFGYRFVASISTDSLGRQLKSLRLKFIGVFLLITALSLALAAWITRLLTTKVGRIQTVMNEIAEDHDFSKRIPVELASSGKPRDELDGLAAHFNQMAAAVQDSQARLIEAGKAEAQAEIAAQVAHDIRSPLTSMGIALNQLQQGVTSDSLSTLKNGIDRVTGILKKLSATYGKKQELSPGGVEAPKLTLIDQLIKAVITEHEVKLSSSQLAKVISTDGFPTVPSTWAVVQVTEIQSAISNILNNAVEAISPEKGKVTVSISNDDRSITLEIRDNGVGIPAENLERIFERKFTHGKAQGTGLGLFQAKAAVEWSGGKISVSSKPGEGTSFRITLPTERAPSWVASQIVLKSTETMVFVDDDPSILSLWKSKTTGSAIQAEFFTSLTELRKRVSTRPWPEDTILVIDQYLGPESSGTTGLKLLAELGLKTGAYLCTSEYDDPAVQQQVRALGGVKLIPKPCISGFVLKMESEST